MSSIRVNNDIRVTTGTNSVPDVTSGTGQEVTAGSPGNVEVVGSNQIPQQPVEGSGYGEGPVGETPSGAPTQVAQPESTTPSASMVTAESSERRDNPQNQDIRRLSSEVSALLGQWANPSSSTKMPTMTLSQGPGGVGADGTPVPFIDGNAVTPSESTINDAKRIVLEDAALPNESTRSDVFSSEDIANARINDAMVDTYTPVQDRKTYSNARTNVEPRQEYNAEQQTMSNSMRNSIRRSKPSIFDRLVGRTQRKQAQLSTDNMPTHRPRDIVPKIKDLLSDRFGKHGIGVRIYGKMIPLPTLDFREVGVGMQEITAVIEQNPDMLDELIKRNVPTDKLRLVNFMTTRTMLVGEVADLVNDNNIEVFTAKPPNNRGQDVQRRILRILESEQRGIYLHPVMAAMYTADFDGDDIQVSLDPSLAKNAKDPMAHMVGIDGAQSLDTNLLPVSQIYDDYEEGKTRRDYVRENMLSKFMSWSSKKEGEKQFDSLVDAVLKLSETALQGSDEQAVAWGDVFRASRDLADILGDNRERSSNKTMSSIVQAVYSGMRNLRVNNALMTVGEIVPRDTLPKAFTSGDSALYKIIDGMVMGAIPNNFQELKVMMNGFLGNVSGKSAPFRFTADVGKMMKFDSRFQIGDNGEYVIKPEDEVAMTDMLQKTVKFAYSKKMATDVKAAGKSMYFTEVLRKRVLDEVGFPEKHENMAQFLWAFAESYNRNAAMINEANLVWLTNMSISSKSNRKVVASIKNVHNGNLKYRDVASPLIEVYGTYSFDRLFGGNIEYKNIDDRSERAGGPNKIEVDWRWSRNGTQWIKSRYKTMSIKAFSVGNHIVMDDQNNPLLDKMVKDATSNSDVMIGMIAALADKRTSTSSKFNTDVMGKYNSRDGKRSGLSETTTKNGTKKTVVSMMREPLTDIRNADLEGTMLSPGYYAGIGSRETPDDVKEMMTALAKRLADAGFTLRSGHAQGADQAFERGAGSNADIFLPYKGFEKKIVINGRSHTYEDMSVEDRTAAEQSVTRYHPNGANLAEAHKIKIDESRMSPDEIKRLRGKQFGYKAHRRNHFQVVGSNGLPDSAFVACWTPADSESHGTDQALRIARDRGIPIFNAAEYDDLQQWADDVYEAAMKAQAGNLYRSTSMDQMLHVDDAVMALNATGYDMFRDLEMDSTAGFLNSEFGRKLIEYADSADNIASIRASMVFKWQTMGITRIVDQLRQLNADIEAGEHVGVERYMDLKNRAVFAMDELDAKSNAWHGIMMELRSKKKDSAFSQLMKPEGRRGYQYWMALDFWNNPDNGYTSLRQVIEDLDMPWTLKCDIITDVVRWQTQDYHVNNFEIAFQLEVGGDSRYSLNGGAPKAALQVYRDMESASNRYANRSLRNLRDEVTTAANHHRGRSGALTNTIHRLATSPWELVEFDDRMYADAILAVRDKVYAQSEKAKKHPATTAAYSALSLQRNGGYFNDVYRFDNRVLGLQHTSQLSPADLLKVLDDPNYAITVYDDYGSIGFLDQQTLLGIDHPASEQEIWDFLVQNPRIACMLRTTAACVMADTNAKGYLGTRLSLDETINAYGNGGHDVMGHIKYVMREHTVYAGLISLLNPGHGTSTRNERNRVPKVEEAICRELYHAAAVDGEMAATRVLSNLGITRLKLRSLLTSDFDKFLAEMELGWNRESIGEAKSEADDIYDTLESHIAKYIAEIKREVPFSRAFFKSYDLPENHIDLNMDIESIASFWDAVQETSGAKVGVSTGIEGAETYQLSYWVSHMGAKDHYANLEAIADLIYESDDPSAFDGMWTNKGNLEVTVDEDGNVMTNISALQSMKTHEGDEIVTQVPDGFDVPDRSTDSYGNPVSSLYAAMVSKRSNGAEKFNLKAMKAGLDGLDSITKMRGGKYLSKTYKNGMSAPVFFYQVAEELGDIAAEQGIDMARMELARRMMEQDREMGYDDMTLANYMSIAELMLIEGGEDGGVILRSLEQMVAGARGRLGSRVDEMTDKEVSKKISEIISDTSEQGIGRSLVWHPQELLADMRPKGNAGDAMASVKISSSVFQRNYDLLKRISKETGIRPMDSGEKKEIHDRIMTVNGVRDVWSRSNIVRNYQVIGYVGASDGSSLLYENIGPSTAVIIGDGNVNEKQVEDLCDKAYDCGTTVIVSRENLSSVPSWCVKDMIPINDKGDMMIPTFDARLNGSEAKPFEPRFAIFQVPFSRYVISAEDPFNVFELGDAQYKFTRSLISRVKAHSSDEVLLQAKQLFPNVYANEKYRDADFSVSLANGDLVRDLICNPETPNCTIDYGLVEGAKGFNQRVHDVNAAIRRYKTMIGFSDDRDSVLRGVDGIAPGDIVAWADMTISLDGQPDQHVLAPIIPFQLHQGKRAPESFKVVDVGPERNDGSLFSVNWSFDRDIDEGNGYIKYFDSSGGANKGIINLTGVIDDTMRLKNGMDMDAYCASFSTDSRKIGTDRRIKTMISLMAIARMQGYNFARMDGAFPDDPDIKEKLSNTRLSIEFWAKRYENQQSGIEKPIRFSTDPQIDAFLNYECRKIYENGGNPSDYLANVFKDEDGNDCNTGVMWEFECMFENSLNYEDSLLRFLHFMDDKLCPSGIDDDTEDTYFRLYREGKDDLGTGYDRGMLQMQVPYPMEDGRIAYVWSNVFVGLSFFGEEWSGNSRPNVSGASDMLDAENTESYYGMPLSKDKSRIRAAWATADEGRFTRDAGAIGLE